jgi:sec-independent protein translocase protein TatC
MVPLLFICGVLFGYFVVLDRAVGFLQNFNDDSFDILLQAKDYFKFAVFFLAGIGLLFQIPVGVLAVTRLGIFTPKQLASNRGYVILGIAVVAAVATPTPDPVTMTLAMAPLIVLFELSILLARWLDRIRPPAEDDELDEDASDDGATDDDPTGDDSTGADDREAADEDEDGRDEPEDDDPLAAYEDDDEELDSDVVGRPDVSAAAEAVQEASEADSPKLEGSEDPDSKD